MVLPSLPSDLSVVNDVTTRYAYDTARRLVKEGNKTYRYGYLDKVLSVTEGAKTYTYDYHVDGQLARADYGNGGRAGCPQPAGSEDFLWDGLALIRRGDERFVNEPHIGGGNPVASSKGTKYFNDILGTTVGAKSGKYGKYTPAALTAFGENLSSSAVQPSTSNLQPFYTGKPEVAGLGHAFLFRNYRAGLAKWQTADPLGYPDGWNALAYCNNGVTSAVDLWGCSEWRVIKEWNNPLSDGKWEEVSRDAPSDSDILDLIARCSVGWVKLNRENKDTRVPPVYSKYENSTGLTWYKNEVWTYMFMRTTTYSITVTTKELKDDPSCWHALKELMITFGAAIPGRIGKIIEAYGTAESSVNAFEELMDSINQYGKDSVWTIPIGTVFYSKERQSSCGFLKVRE